MELRFKIYNLFKLEKDISPTEKRSKRKFDIIQIILTPSYELTKISLKTMLA